MSKAHPYRGAALMVCAMLLLPFMDLGAKKLGNQGIPIAQIVWGRMFFSAAIMLPFAMRLAGPAGLWPTPLLLHIMRAILLMSATFSFFLALQHLPIADALAIFFIQPILVTLLSRIFLKETVSSTRWAAVIVSFIASLIIIRPGIQNLNTGVFYSLGAGLALAVYFTITRKLAGSTNAILMTIQTNLAGTALLSLVVLAWWQHLNVEQWGWMALVGFAASAGHYLIVKAYEHSDASLLAPLAYSEIINAVNLGWIFFGDFPDRWTFLGVAILIASAIFVSWREKKSAS